MEFVFKTKIVGNHGDELVICGFISKAPLCKGSSAAGGEGLYYFELFYNPSDSLREPPPLAQWRLNEVCI